MRLRVTALMVALLAVPAPRAEAQNLSVWVNQRVDTAVAARLAQRGSGRQVEPPSIARGSTALVDNAAFSDLAGLALGLLPFAGEAENESGVQTTGITLTPYAFLTAILGLDPDDPLVYARRNAWRSFALTLGVEDIDDDGGRSRAALVGVKVRLWSRQAEPDSALVQALKANLRGAAAGFGNLDSAIEDSLFVWVGGEVGIGDPIEFSNRLTDAATTQAYLELAGPERVAVLERMVADQIDAFVRLRRTASAVVESLRKEPQLALSVQSRIREDGSDQVRFGLAFDVGLTERATWTLNGGGAVNTGTPDDGTAWGGTVASALNVALRDDRLVGADPLAFDVAAEGQFLDGEAPTWRLQGKFTVPVMEGMALPLSVTWASRTELVDESDVIGRLGFTVDTSRLLASVAGR